MVMVDKLEYITGRRRAYGHLPIHTSIGHQQNTIKKMSKYLQCLSSLHGQNHVFHAILFILKATLVGLWGLSGMMLIYYIP